MARNKLEVGSYVKVFVAVVAVLDVIGCVIAEEILDGPYDFLYSEGEERYLHEDWEGCVKYLEKALKEWHLWQTNTVRCRKKCAVGNYPNKELFSSNLSEQERFFEKSVRGTLCLLKCKKSVYGSRMDRIAEAYVEEDFETRKPYDYLQLCYYKLDRLKDAADAAATVLASQPDHEVMKTNLKFYLVEGDIRQETVIDKEMKEYGKLYLMGDIAYSNSDFGEAVRLMEESLKSYYEAHEDCRLLCEKAIHQGSFPDLIAAIANHFTSTLRCKRRCSWQLGDFNGTPIDDFFSSYFNYLQYSYYQEGDYKRASEAVACCLVMDPDDEVQINNKAFYLREGKITEEMFVPRKDVLAYKERLDFEEKMVTFIDTEFRSLYDDELPPDVNANIQTMKKGDPALKDDVPSSINLKSLEEGLDSKNIVLDSVVKDEL